MNIHFIDRKRQKLTLNVEPGYGSVMELAVDNGVYGIDGNCGGVCSCATCHVHVSDADRDRIGGPSEDELDILSFEPNFTESSRLCCQIEVTADIDGATFIVPSYK